jgi:hypothetical protein
VRHLTLFYVLQHVPRINGEIPSIDEVTSDHQRLLDRYYTSWHIDAYVSLSLCYPAYTEVILRYGLDS